MGLGSPPTRPGLEGGRQPSPLLGFVWLPTSRATNLSQFLRKGLSPRKTQKGGLPLSACPKLSLCIDRDDGQVKGGSICPGGPPSDLDTCRNRPLSLSLLQPATDRLRACDHPSRRPQLAAGWQVLGAKGRTVFRESWLDFFSPAFFSFAMTTHSACLACALSTSVWPPCQVSLATKRSPLAWLL